MKKILVASVVMFMMALLTMVGSVTSNADDSTHSYYARVMVVNHVNECTDEIECVDFNGEGWVFDGTEDWEIGDYVAVCLDDNATPDYIYDDEIVSTQYSGYLQGKFGITSDGETVIEMRY